MSKKSLIFTFATLVFFAGCEVPFDMNFSSEEPTEESDEESTGFIDEEELSGIQWSTYTSEEFGFSVNFPSTWDVEEDAQGRPYVSFTSPERTGGTEGDQMIKIDAQIKVYSDTEDLPNNAEDLSFEEWIETENSYFDGQPMQTTVDGVSGYSMRSKGFANIESEFIMIEHDGKIYELNFNVPDANDYEEERQGMLESFQFLSSSGSETSATVSGSCNEEACFMENFKTCEPATLSSMGGSSSLLHS